MHRACTTTNILFRSSRTLAFNRYTRSLPHSFPLPFQKTNNLLSVPRVLQRASSSSSKNQETIKKAKTTILKTKSKLKEMWTQYGMIFIGTYLTTYVITLGSVYVAMENGVIRTRPKKNKPQVETDEEEDFDMITTTNRIVALAERLGVAKWLDIERVDARSGTFLLAWIATKFTEPFRLALTVAVTPRIARLLGRAPKK